MNKFQSDFDKYATIFLQENWFENAVGWRPFCPGLGVLICAYWQKTGNLGLNRFFIFKDSFEVGDF